MYSFNSTLVRLRRGWAPPGDGEFLSFNSTLVRLRQAKALHNAEMGFSFNSTLVRLRRVEEVVAVLVDPLVSIPLWFD